MTLRIAMWSGPRNLSTALMYAFAARGDCAVWDEPFYAAYLAATGIDHPMRGEVIAAGITDPAEVARRCAGPAPDGSPVFYQKQMTMHMVAGFPLGFMAACTNVFLIRHPARVVASYVAKRENPTLADLGFVQQADLFDREADRIGRAPPVIDSTDIRADPRASLSRLCGAVGLDFTDRMLSWPPGPKPHDGVWAPHWYPAVHRSTGFDAAEGDLPVLTGNAADIAEAGLPHYDRLRRHAL
jgi:hypothetical protein